MNVNLDLSKVSFHILTVQIKCHTVVELTLVNLVSLQVGHRKVSIQLDFQGGILSEFVRNGLDLFLRQIFSLTGCGCLLLQLFEMKQTLFVAVDSFEKVFELEEFVSFVLPRGNLLHL